jgi:hypothetical protein
MRPEVHYRTALLEHSLYPMNIRLHDMDRPWNMNVDYNRPFANIALPLYYAALLGHTHHLLMASL